MSRIHEIIGEILHQYPEIDLYTIKKKGQSFDAICKLIPEEQRRDLTITLLILFVTHYYPLPENFKERLDCLDQSHLDRLISDAWSNSVIEKRKILEELLTEEELAPTTLGYALRIGGYTETSFYLSSCRVTDYSTNTIARTIIREAKTSSDRKYAKEMILRALQEELAFQLIFIPVDVVCNELLLIDTPNDLTDDYRYDFVCPISDRHVYLNIPECYQLTTAGCCKINLMIAGDCSLSYLLWQRLRLTTCSQYNLLVTSISLDQAKSLLEMHHFVDLFLCSYHYLLKEVIGDCLANKYIAILSSHDANLFMTLYQSDKENIRNMLGECLTDCASLNRYLLGEKIKIHLKTSPSLKEKLIKKEVALSL